MEKTLLILFSSSTIYVIHQNTIAIAIAFPVVAVVLVAFKFDAVAVTR
ncbi:uncharacterized protein METZ01_LOCUS357425, partial [marine metagenome]